MPKPKPKPAAKPKRKPVVKKNLKAEKHPGGRPSKYTAEVVERICYSLSQGNTRTTAATCAGVALSTFHAWLNEFSEFSEAIKRAEEQAIEHYVNVIHTASTQTWQAASWYLERRRKEDFGKQDKVDITTNGKDINGMSMEEMVAELKRIEQIKQT